MRPHPGKEYALWLDHAGNLSRFWEDQVDVFENGVSELNDGKHDSKVRKEKTEAEKAEFCCKSCGFMFRGKVCPACGTERKSKSDVIKIWNHGGIRSQETLDG